MFAPAVHQGHEKAPRAKGRPLQEATQVPQPAVSPAHVRVPCDRFDLRHRDYFFLLGLAFKAEASI
jgi:hypothetical protein